jgi:hypothetical protein
MTEVKSTNQERKPTKKERRFIDVYLETWNGTEAARQAGYSSPRKLAYQVINRPHVQAAINAQLKESAMQADEALKRLADQARLNVADFYIFEMVDTLDDDGNPVIDPVTGEVKQHPVNKGINWQAVIEKGHLVKGIDYDRRGNVVLKLHDSQNALIHIGKHLKLFVDTIDLNFLNALKAYIGVSPDDWDEDEQHQISDSL